MITLTALKQLSRSIKRSCHPSNALATLLQPPRLS